MRAAPLILVVAVLAAAGCEVESRTALAPRTLTIQAGGSGTAGGPTPLTTPQVTPAARAASPAPIATDVTAPVTGTVGNATGAVDACRSGDARSPVDVVYVSGGGGSGAFRLVRPGSLTDAGAWPEGQRLRAMCGRDGPDGLNWLRVVDDAGNAGWVASRYLSASAPVAAAPRPPAAPAGPGLPPLGASPTLGTATANLTPAGIPPAQSPGTETPTPAAAVAATPTAIATATATPAATATATPTGTPTNTPTPTLTPTNTPTATATPTSCYLDEEIILAPVVTTDVVRLSTTITIIARSARSHNNVRLEATEHPTQPAFQSVVLRGDIWEWTWTSLVTTTNAHEYRLFVSNDQLCRRKRVTVTS